MDVKPVFLRLQVHLESDHSIMRSFLMPTKPHKTLRKLQPKIQKVFKSLYQVTLGDHLMFVDNSGYDLHKKITVKDLLALSDKPNEIHLHITAKTITNYKQHEKSNQTRFAKKMKPMEIHSNASQNGTVDNNTIRTNTVSFAIDKTRDEETRSIPQAKVKPEEITKSEHHTEALQSIALNTNINLFGVGTQEETELHESNSSPRNLDELFPSLEQVFDKLMNTTFIKTDILPGVNESEHLDKDEEVSAHAKPRHRRKTPKPIKEASKPAVFNNGKYGASLFANQ